MDTLEAIGVRKALKAGEHRTTTECRIHKPPSGPNSLVIASVSMNGCDQTGSSGVEAWYEAISDSNT